jgi:large subunit ribosomal protein L31
MSMKKNHPEFHDVVARCFGCGHTYQSYSTGDTIKVEMCAKCHPFYTGEQRFIDTAGRIERFERRYKKKA